MAGILAGLRVLELTSGIAGPVASLLLAESGAEVIKVEPPGGDEDQDSAGFAVWNRSKRRVALDLQADRARLDELIAGADVLLLDFTPKEARRLGLEDQALAARHPRLIVCTITGYPVGHALEEVRHAARWSWRTSACSTSSVVVIATGRSTCGFSWATGAPHTSPPTP